MRKKRTLLLILVIFISAFGKMKESFFRIPAKWPKPVYDFSRNPLTKEKIELGRILFYDPLLSKNNTISCASCHSPFTAFAHVDHNRSHGINDRIGKRNAPPLFNLAWQKQFMWDGAINHLDMQALAPISHPDEMGETISGVVEKLQQHNLYPMLFKKAYGDSIITGERTLKAIAQFLLTIESYNSRYDSVMRGEQAFTAQEQNGYRLFKNNCSSCHSEPFFTNLEFANNGLPVDTLLNDKGRMQISMKEEDAMKFKVPSLRNIEFTYPYMHDGRFKKLTDVLNHYTNGIRTSPTLSDELQKKIVLTSNEKTDLVAFLLTLTDKSFLFNPEYGYPKYLLTEKK